MGTSILNGGVHTFTMHPLPEPLPLGTLLAERFELMEPLGQGGFGITYLAKDLSRDDLCVVKELAPEGAQRDATGELVLAHLGHAEAQRLRHQFLQEARLLAGLKAPGILAVRTSFQDRGTAYFARDYRPQTRSLEKVLQQDGRFSQERAETILLQLLETLEVLHSKGVLHRDLKPSNILLGENDEAFLIDFGSARQWHSDLDVRHTVQFTPGFAPPEQLSELAKRGPGTDLYGLCATAYCMLTSQPPPPATDRLAGLPLIPLSAVRPDIEPAFAQAIESGLRLELDQRPPSARALAESFLAKGEAGLELSELQRLDSAKLRLRRFRYGKAECPSCGDVLEKPKPLGNGVCAVCRHGRIHQRKILEKICPICKAGALRPLANQSPLKICPACGTGSLRSKNKVLLFGIRTYTCSECSEVFKAQLGVANQESTGEAMTWPKWLERSGRSEQVWRCDLCHAQFDREQSGRWKQMVPIPSADGWISLFPDEWARVAAGLDPGIGNAECLNCGADYFFEGSKVTLLDAPKDPYGFARDYLGRLLDRCHLSWLAAGKSSGHPGLLCKTCRTEFDNEADQLRLVTSKHKGLRTYTGQIKSFGNWHRVAQELPEIGHEQELEVQLSQVLMEAFYKGELHFDSKRPSLIWRGQAERVLRDESGWASSGRAQLVVTDSGLEFGGMLRKTRVEFELINKIEFEENVLCLYDSEGGLLFAFLPDPVELEVNLQSGRYHLALDGDALHQRLLFAKTHPVEPDAQFGESSLSFAP